MGVDRVRLYPRLLPAPRRVVQAVPLTPPSWPLVMLVERVRLYPRLLPAPRRVVQAVPLTPPSWPLYPGLFPAPRRVVQAVPLTPPSWPLGRSFDDFGLALQEWQNAHVGIAVVGNVAGRRFFLALKVC